MLGYRARAFADDVRAAYHGQREVEIGVSTGWSNLDEYYRVSSLALRLAVSRAEGAPACCFARVCQRYALASCRLARLAQRLLI